MRTPFLVTLLIIFLCGFLWLEQITRSLIQANDIRIIGISVLDPKLRGMLGIGVVALEFIIVFFSLLDRVGDTIKAVLKPLVALLPLGAFVFTSIRTFLPLFGTMLPDTIAADLGVAQSGDLLAQAVNDGSFATNVVLTFFTMILFAIVTTAVSRPTDVTAELKRLRAENERYRKLLQ